MNVIYFCRFNAIVSKTVNKHGDHAVSVSDHTRYFYPTGHGIKINHFFPSKDHLYHNIENAEGQKPSKLSAPVQESEEAVPKKDGKVMLMSGDKLMVLEPVKTAEQIESKEIDIPKAEEAPVTVIPAVVSMIMNNHEIVKHDDSKTSPMITNTEESQKSDKKEHVSDANIGDENISEPSSDSEVASSYYHTRFYYVGF